MSRSKVGKSVSPPSLVRQEHGGGDKIRERERTTLPSGQRLIGLRMMKRYRTLSGEAVRVIGGLIPMDLGVDRRWVCNTVKLKGEVMWEGVKSGKVGSKRKIREGIIEVRQRRGEAGTAGRWTYVKGTLVGNRIQPGYPAGQIVGGHGNLNGKLFQLGLIRSGMCGCREGVEHSMFDCPQWEGDRIRLGFKMGREDMWGSRGV